VFVIVAKVHGTRYVEGLYDVNSQIPLKNTSWSILGLVLPLGLLRFGDGRLDGTIILRSSKPRTRLLPTY
jgi:hypothetical protein